MKAVEAIEAEEPLPADVAKVGPREVRLRLPVSYSTREDIWVALLQSTQRATAAALGACWTGNHAPKASYERCGYNALTYGGQVRDELIGHGVSSQEITIAGMKAWNLIAESMPSVEDVENAEVFTRAQEVPKT